MTNRLLLFGATGDLAGRYIFPALAEMESRRELPDEFEIIGAARRERSDDEFRAHVKERLDTFASDLPASARQSMLQRVHYRSIDLGTDESVGAVRDVVSDGRPIIAYLALPPTTFERGVQALEAAKLPQGSRIAIEKPFGDSLESAKRLNQLLSKVTGPAGEGAVFRVDHVMGMATVHNLLGVRLANRVLEPVWNSTHIEAIEFLWEETIALEGRAAYFDHAGALKDVMQNHVLQVVALIAMDLPISLNERDLRDSKVDVLRAVRPPAEHEMAMRTRRARYTAGRLAKTGGASGEEVPNYVDEKGVDASRNTETWAEIELRVDNWRWSGTRFILRAGKALQQRKTGVVVHYRPVPHNAFGRDTHLPPRNQLAIGLDNPQTLNLYLTGSKPGPPLELRPLTLGTELPASEQRAYSAVFRDVLAGDCTLSIRGDEAEQQWRIMEPVLKAWAENRVPMEEYVAGSSGPRPRVTRVEMPSRETGTGESRVTQQTPAREDRSGR